MKGIIPLSRILNLISQILEKLPKDMKLDGKMLIKTVKQKLYFRIKLVLSKKLSIPGLKMGIKHVKNILNN